MDVEQLQLRRNSFISILSARRSGKSYLIGDLAYYFLTNPENKVDLIYMFSNTAMFDKDNYEWLDSRAILPADPESINNTIENIFNIQEATQFKKNILIVFDDIDLTNQFTGINALAVRGRHYKITTILSAQITTCAISPSIRNNTSYLFFRRFTAKAIKDQIYSIVHTFEKSNDLYQYVQNNIKDYQFLFYDNESDDQELKSIKAVKRNFIYKLPKPKPQKNPQASKAKYKYYGYKPIKPDKDNISIY